MTKESLNKILSSKFKTELTIAENLTLYHLYNLSLNQTKVTKNQLMKKNEVFYITIPELIDRGYIIETTETYLSLNTRFEN